MMIKFVAFDLDGVLVDARSSWCWVHEHFGVNNEQSLRDYLDGKIDDWEFMRRDISLWLGKREKVNIHDIEEILVEVPLMRGAKEAVAKLRSADIKTAVISSGLEPLAKRVGDELELDFVLANGLQMDIDGNLTGEGILNVGLRDKGPVLQKLLATLNLRAEECAAVGNSFIDVGMFEHAGLKIAFDPEDEVVRTKANVIIEDKNLTRILPYMLGERK